MAIYLPRSVDMVLAVVAVLRAGLSYIPLDPAYPRERLDFIVADARVAAVLARRDVQGLLPGTDAPTIFIDDVPDDGAEIALGSLARGRSANDGAYTIYTSGSTGRPRACRCSSATWSTFSTRCARRRAWRRMTSCWP